MAAFASWQQTRQLPTAQLSPPPRKQHLFPHQGDDMFNMLLVRDELSNENPHRDMVTALSLAARLPQPQGGSWLFPDRLNHLRASWIQSVLTEWGVKPAQRAPKCQEAAEPGVRRVETTQLLCPDGSQAVPKPYTSIPLTCAALERSLYPIFWSFLVPWSLCPCSISDPYLGSGWGWPEPEGRQRRYSQPVHHHLVHLGVLNHHQID